MAKQFNPSVLGKSHPETTHAYEISVVSDSNLFSEYEQLSPKSWDIRQGLFQALLHFQLIRLTLKAHWTFLSIYTPKRLIHSGANGFKPDNVPLSLRDTGYSHSDHKVSLPVHQVTLCIATVYSVGSLVSGHDKDRFMFTNLDPSLRGDRNSTSSTVLSHFRVNFPFSPNHCHLTPCSSQTMTHTIAIYMCIDEYILAIFTHLNLSEQC